MTYKDRTSVVYYQDMVDLLLERDNIVVTRDIFLLECDSYYISSGENAASSRIYTMRRMKMISLSVRGMGNPICEGLDWGNYRMEVVRAISLEQEEAIKNYVLGKSGLIAEFTHEEILLTSIETENLRNWQLRPRCGRNTPFAGLLWLLLK